MPCHLSGMRRHGGILAPDAALLYLAVVYHVCDAVCAPRGVPAVIGHLLLVIVGGQKVCCDHILHKHLQ